MITPLNPIPASWATRGRCPVCGAAPLALEQPDQLACGRCGAAFQAETGGPRVRLMRLPSGIKASADDAWRTASEARDWVRGLAVSPAPAALEPDPVLKAEAASLTVVASEPEALATTAASSAALAVPPEALARAEQLLALHHSLPQIQQILTRTQTWTPEQIAAVIGVLGRRELEARRRQDRQLLLILGGAVSLLLVLGLWAALTMNNAPADTALPEATPRPGLTAAALATATPVSPLEALVHIFVPDTHIGVAPGLSSAPGAAATPAPQAPAWYEVFARLFAPAPREAVPTPVNGASSNPATPPAVDESGLPSALQTLIPPGARLINPTPEIRRGAGSGAPPAQACPASPAAAAQLFGGDASAWHFEENGRGWIMISPTQLVSVRVPANMTAGYLAFGQSLNLNQVNGPAVLNGLNMVVISCE